MGWHLTRDIDEYATAASGFLSARPVDNTVALGVVDGVRAGRYPGGENLFGWWDDDAGVVAGACSHTPPYELLLTATPEESLDPLAVALEHAGWRGGGVHGTASAASAFAAAWTGRTGQRGVPKMAQRLFRLTTLQPPAKPPAGQARVAGQRDAELMVRWTDAFNAEAGAPQRGAAEAIAHRVKNGGLTVWEVDGQLVSMAGSTTSHQVARIGPVYTPPEHRRNGFGTAVTAAVSQGLLDAGVDDVVLFTDLANPTSNAIYQRLGYRPVEDRQIISFEPQ